MCPIDKPNRKVSDAFARVALPKRQNMPLKSGLLLRGQPRDIVCQTRILRNETCEVATLEPTQTGVDQRFDSVARRLVERSLKTDQIPRKQFNI